MKKEPKVSVIIPARTVDGLTFECVDRILDQEYDSFEIILLPDKPAKIDFPKTKIVVTGPIRPAEKRNIGIKKAKGEIIAFIDSDAYPEGDWLGEAVKYFKDKSIGAVGGPNLTPKEANILEFASGDIFASWVTSGKFAARYSIKREEPHSELPSCNLFFRKEILDQFGGFDKTLLTGEDAKLCFQTNGVGKKIMYSPKVRVRHHRRPLFYPHLRQIYIYGRDKASLAKELLPILPQLLTFDRLVYLLPSSFVLTVLVGLALAFFFPIVKLILVIILSFYMLLVALSYLFGIKKIDPFRFFLFIIGVPLTHFAYGLGFVKGMLSKRTISTLNKR